jgi:hypothetical protein
MQIYKYSSKRKNVSKGKFHWEEAGGDRREGTPTPFPTVVNFLFGRAQKKPKPKFEFFPGVFL